MAGWISSRSLTRLSARRLRPRSAPTNRRDELRRGVGQDLGRRAELRDHAAVLEDRDEVADLDGLVDVVGDEQDRLGQLLLEPQELVLETVADDGVDRPEGLVHEHDRRVHRERPGDADALPLAARQLVREAVAVLRGVQADQRQQLVRAGPQPFLRPAEQARHGRHVVADGLVREQPHLLDDVADAPTQLGDVASRGIHAVDQDAPAGRLDEPVHHLEAGGLAASRRADEHADLAGRHRQRQVVHGARCLGRLAVLALDRRVVALGHVLEFDDRGAAGG